MSSLRSRVKNIYDLFRGSIPFEEREQPLNAAMKKKQTIWGLIVLVLLLLIALVLHILAAGPKGSSQLLKKSVVKAPDGILSADFTEKDNLSAFEDQQQQINLLKNHIDKLTALSEKLKVSKEKAQKHQPSKSQGVDVLPISVVSRHILSKDEKVSKPIHFIDPNNGVNDLTDQRHGVTINQERPAEMATLNFSYAKPVVPSASETEYYPQLNDPRHTLSSKNKLSHEISIKRKHSLKTVKTYVPAGTFVRGVLLEGADANASVNGQSDTVPILVRLLDQGTLPNGGHSRLKGCFVLASIYGDISSERGEARLDKLSCTRKDGSILEVSVQGHVSFAGKEGIKGMPVMRNGKILTMAGISGALSGFGSALQQTTQTISTSSLGSVATVRGNDIFKSGAYGGASTAMARLARYYIQRAEQYHPIISIGSGTVATVIFQHGFSLIDEKNTEEIASVVSKTNEASHEELAEMKSLLATAKQTAATNHEPVTNLSNMTLGQRIEN